jgi:SAM-dependent MidA family methyltransferase
LKAGFVVTIDYGGETATLIERARRGDFLFRIYCDGAPFTPQVNSPYVRVGLQDLTADVDFGALSTAGSEGGLNVVHYGLERDLAGPFLPELLGQLEDRRVAEFLSTPSFRVLIQAQGGLSLSLGPLSARLPLEP